MLKLDLNQIYKYLTAKSYNVQLQSETNQVCILQKIEERDYPLFIRIFDGGELLQLLAFIPCNTKPTTLSDTARLLHLLNKEIDFPGLGMDEDNLVVFHRIMLPIKKKEVDEETLEAVINAIHLTCTSFAPIIATVAYGMATFEDIVKKAEAAKQSIAENNFKRND